MLPTLMLGALLLAPAFHSQSLSSSSLRVDGEQVALTVRCQVLSLLEVIPGLDANGDGVVDPTEVAARAAPISRYVAEHYRVASGRRADGGDRRVLVPDPQPPSVLLLPPQEHGAPGDRKGHVDVSLRYTDRAPIAGLWLTCNLFATTSPGHVDLASVAFADRTSHSLTLDAEHPAVHLLPRDGDSFAPFLRLGVHHILSGWDHLAFLLALVLACRRARSLLGVVTAFTVAHSISLALAATGVLDVRPIGGLVEAAIALSIAWVAADSLIHPHLSRTRWPEAGGFGLVHGLGFASALQDSLVHEQSTALALFGFNLGVELGQLAVVLALVFLLRQLPRAEHESDPFLAPPLARRALGVAVTLLGLSWFFQRL